MKTFFLIAAFTFWSFLGIFVWTGLHFDVRRWYKKIILFLMCGPIIWLFNIMLLSLLTFDSLEAVYERFRKWMIR